MTLAPFCRSFYYAGVFDGTLELFYSQLANGQQPDGGLFDRFLIQCMLFHHAVLTCSSYKGTSGAFELSSAARSQVSYAIQHTHVEHKLYVRARLMCIISHVLLHADACATMMGWYGPLLSYMWQSVPVIKHIGLDVAPY